MSIVKEKNKNLFDEVEVENNMYAEWMRRKGWEKRSFAKIAQQYIYRKGLTYANFTVRTGLNKDVYYDIMNDDIKPTIETVVSFCVGIGADISTIEELAKAAGYTFEGNKTHQYYAYLFERLAKKSINDWNDFLLNMGKRPLTRLYKGTR